MSYIEFDFKKLIDETKAMLFTPADYFTIMSKEGGFGEPLVKAFIFSFIAGLLLFLGSYVKLNSSTGILGSLFGGQVGINGLISALIVGLLATFIGGAILLVISIISNGNLNYELNVRVASSLLLLFPIGILFGFLAFNSVLDKFISLILSFYFIWLLFLALTKSLGCNGHKLKIILSVSFLIYFLMLFSPLICNKKNEPDQNLQKLSEDYKKAIQD